MIGTTLQHGRIVGKLGEGGMGQVHAAEYTKLRRRVALKLLPSDMAADPERLQRFQREAQANAALNHPNVVTIHSVEEADGRLKVLDFGLAMLKPDALRGVASLVQRRQPEDSLRQQPGRVPAEGLAHEAVAEDLRADRGDVLGPPRVTPDGRSVFFLRRVTEGAGTNLVVLEGL